MYSSCRTPAARVQRLNQSTVKVPHDADVKQRFLNVGNEVVASSAEALAAAIKREMTTLGKVIKDAGIRAGVGH
jgi:tripartite-type tricarboxylate transporter receptor subunit TctC